MAEPHALLADRYRLLREVGRGGMGVVWEARDERLERPVAVKELRPQLGLTPEEAELAKNRAMREARITARLHHRNAVPVFDVVEHEGQPCLIMQFLPCVPLSAVLRESGPLGVHEAARIGAEVASALAAAHALDIVHRDVKPGNILIADDGLALISDFGISHAVGDATLTSTGLVHGTPAYLAPEVARGADSSFASDVFSLGATLYACLQGAPPFGTDSNSIALLYRVASGEFAAPRRAGAMTPVLLDMLRSDPAARPTMKEAAGRLAAVEAGDDVAPTTLPMLAPISAPVAAPAPAPSPEPPPEATGTTQVRPSNEPPTFAAALPTATMPAAETPAVVEPAARPPAPPTPPDAHPGRRRRGRWIGAVALLVGLLVLGTTLVLGQLRGGGDGNVADPGTARSSATTAPSEPSPSGSESSDDDPTPASSASDAPSPSPTRETPSSSPSPSPTSSASSGEPTADELENAITGYYALVPKDTDEAWSRLTSAYQRNPSGGRQAYENFWDQVDRVSVSKVKADPPSRVEATLTYRRGDSVSVERTRFRLVRDDGVLKIAESGPAPSS